MLGFRDFGFLGLRVLGFKVFWVPLMAKALRDAQLELVVSSNARRSRRPPWPLAPGPCWLLAPKIN